MLQTCRTPCQEDFNLHGPARGCSACINLTAGTAQEAAAARTGAVGGGRRSGQRAAAVVGHAALQIKFRVYRHVHAANASELLGEGAVAEDEPLLPSETEQEQATVGRRRRRGVASSRGVDSQRVGGGVAVKWGVGNTGGETVVRGKAELSPKEEESLAGASRLESMGATSEDEESSMDGATASAEEEESLEGESLLEEESSRDASVGASVGVSLEVESLLDESPEEEESLPEEESLLEDEPLEDESSKAPFSTVMPHRRPLLGLSAVDCCTCLLDFKLPVEPRCCRPRTGLASQGNSDAGRLDARSLKRLLSVGCLRGKCLDAEV